MHAIITDQKTFGEYFKSFKRHGHFVMDTVIREFFSCPVNYKNIKFPTFVLNRLPLLVCISSITAVLKVKTSIPLEGMIRMYYIIGQLSMCNAKALWFMHETTTIIALKEYILSYTCIIGKYCTSS